MTITTKEFWFAALERAAKTFAQTLVALWTAGGIGGILDVAWVPSLSVAGLAALISLLTSIGSDWATGGGPSLAGEELKTAD